MHQVLTRRFKDPTEGIVPDIVFIDGGKGQLKQAEDVIGDIFSRFKVKPPLIVAVAKGEGRKEGLETLIMGYTREEFHLNLSDPALQIVLHIRDESHRFAITGHRNRRQKARTHSVLEDIQGIGPKRRQALLKHLGGIREVNNASVDELKKYLEFQRKWQDKFMMNFIHFKRKLNYLSVIFALTSMSVQAQDTIKPSDYIGKTVAFGSYYTDSDKEKSPLIWRVIDCNDNECLLTTDYVVIIGQYHSVEKPMTWKDSDLRYWLNNSFYKSSFNKEEQKYIVRHEIEAQFNPVHDTDPGENTFDNVFILSASEAELLSNEHRKVMATNYANIKAGRSYSNLYDVWWLRNPGLKSVHAMVVGGGNTPSSFIRPNGLLVNVEFVGVRPAIYIKNTDIIKAP